MLLILFVSIVGCSEKPNKDDYRDVAVSESKTKNNKDEQEVDKEADWKKIYADAINNLQKGEEVAFYAKYIKLNKNAKMDDLLVGFKSDDKVIFKILTVKKGNVSVIEIPNKFTITNDYEISISVNLLNKIDSINFVVQQSFSSPNGATLSNEYYVYTYDQEKLVFAEENYTHTWRNAGDQQPDKVSEELSGNVVYNYIEDNKHFEVIASHKSLDLIIEHNQTLKELFTFGGYNLKEIEISKPDVKKAEVPKTKVDAEQPVNDSYVNENFLSIAAKGNLRGIDYSIGTPIQKVLNDLGEPTEEGGEGGGIVLFYQDKHALFHVDALEYIKHDSSGNVEKNLNVPILAQSKMIENQSLKEIRSILGEPNLEGFDATSDQQFISYRTGQYKVKFSAETPTSNQVRIDLSIN